MLSSTIPAAKSPVSRDTWKLSGNTPPTVRGRFYYAGWKLTATESAFDPAHPYYDEKSNRDNPKWSVVHVEFRRKFDHLITLTDLKSHAADGPLEDLQTLKQSRLSVSPVTPQQWEYIMKLAAEKD